jgi:thymidine kinase
MKHHTGSVEVITGSMFCGKTDELIRRLRRATIARQNVQVFKPAIDNRYAERKVTHMRVVTMRLFRSIQRQRS